MNTCPFCQAQFKDWQAYHEHSKKCRTKPREDKRMNCKLCQRTGFTDWYDYDHHYQAVHTLAKTRVKISTGKPDAEVVRRVEESLRTFIIGGTND